MKWYVWMVLALAFAGCAATGQPVQSAELTATVEPGQQYSGSVCPTGCVEQFGVTNPYLLETDITYLQLTTWRYRRAVEAALEAENTEEAQAILTEAHNDVLRLVREQAQWWEGHALDQSCYYCGPVCQEMNILLLHSPVTESHPICPVPAP